MKKLTPWELWCKTIGNKISDDPREADFAAVWRTIWIAVNMITCFTIIANAIRHW